MSQCFPETGELHRRSAGGRLSRCEWRDHLSVARNRGYCLSELSSTPNGEDVTDAAYRSAFPEIQQSADGLGRTRVAADSVGDCERDFHRNGRTHSHDANDEARFQLRVVVVLRPIEKGLGKMATK